MSEETGDVLRALGRIEGRMNAFQTELSDHSRVSSAALAELKSEVTKRANNHADRIASLEHSRTEDKTAKRVIGAFISLIGISNLAMWLKSPWS